MMLVLAGCSEKSTDTPKGTEVAAIDVDAITATSTVEAVDPATRTVTLKASDGATNTYKLGKDVVNFDQIKPGDQVKVTLLDSIAAFVRKSDAPPSAGAGTTITLAPKGAKPGVILADTEELSAKVESVDTAKRTLTVEGAAGKNRTFTVGPNVDLAALKKGDDIVVRATQALAIVVEKP
jgi:hypothetical protein